MESVLSFVQDNFWLTLLGTTLTTITFRTVFDIISAYRTPKVKLEKYSREALALHNGSDPFRPLLLAVKGLVYDVTTGKDFYGKEGGYSIFAGKECSRALATMSLDEKDVNGNLDGLTEKQLKTLQEWIDKFQKKYKVVGEVVDSYYLSIEQLKEYDGSDPKKPMLLSIQGKIFDVSRGKQFYGPQGVYPFAGREVARAFALNSVEESDCTDDLEGLSPVDLQSLSEWEAKFLDKYPLVGKIVKSS